MGIGYVYPPHYLLPELMVDFATWPNSSQAQTLYPVLYAAEAHYRFVSIHPFQDGNGRTGRLLMNGLWRRAGYPIVVITHENSQACLKALVQGQQLEAWQPFEQPMVEATQAALVELLGVLATAADSPEKSLPFYREMLEFLQGQES